MLIFIVVGSILALTGLIHLVRKTTGFGICPVCAGVTGTWLWLLAALFLGYPIGLEIPALLAGGSAVGMVLAAEKGLAAERPHLRWKTLAITVGFLTAYFLIHRQWGEFAFFVILFLGFMAIPLFFAGARLGGKEKNSKVEKLKQKMKDCC